VEQVGSPQEVFDQPASPFVMDFLGNVNVFHGRVQDGHAHVGPFTLPYDAYPHAEPRNATAYVRPHELDLERTPSSPASLPACVVQMNPSGGLVKIRLRSENLASELTVDLARERALELTLKTGETIYVRPRSARVFMPEPEYMI
jgi:sulfate transport system ATP-binding protein